MGKVQTVEAEIRERGQLTIPKAIRTSSRLDDGQAVRVIPLGRSIRITPRRPGIENARRDVRRVLKSAGLSAEEVLKGLEAGRRKLFDERYARKMRPRHP